MALVDAPGFDDTSKSDAEILQMIAAFLETTCVHTGGSWFSILAELLDLTRYEEGSKLAGVIYIHRISDNRFSRAARRNFKMFHELCGYVALKNVVLVTNMWGGVPRDIGEAREKELSSEYFKLVLDNGARMVRHHNTVQSAHDIIRSIVGNCPIVLRIQRELVDEQKDIVNTTAGKAINREFNKQIRRHQAELKEVREEMMQALKEKDEETRQELQEEKRRLRGRIEKIKKDLEGMTMNYVAEKERIEVKVREMERETRGERERAEAEYKRQLADRIHYFQDGISVYVAERLEQEVKRQQALLDGPNAGSWVMVPIYR